MRAGNWELRLHYLTLKATYSHLREKTAGLSKN